MSLTPAQLNATMGFNLALNIVQHVRTLVGAGQLATNRSVADSICASLDIDPNGEAAKGVLRRVRHQVPILEAGGQLRREEHRDRNRNMIHKTIHLP